MQRLFLTGLSGSGKSEVGRRVAQMLGWEYVDTDDLLAGRCEMTVGQIIVQHGEEWFRALESEALVIASQQERVVVSTGGGAVIAEANRAYMRRHGLMVYLHAPVDVAWERVQAQMREAGEAGAAVFRPLVAGDDGQQRMHNLLEARRAWYEEATVKVDTDRLTPDDAARQVVAAALMHGALTPEPAEIKAITIRSDGIGTQSIIEWGGIRQLPARLRSCGFQCRVFIVTDSTVGNLYAEPVLALLEQAGMEPHLFVVAAGEASKSLRSFEQIMDWLVEQRAERSEPIVALGGGVVGDLVGFVAASYHRGAPLVQVPTTLLAQVDSAIGGKTGINHPHGKNLIGAFYQPRLTLVDPALLLTLPERAYREGWGEIVKYGMILDAELFEQLEANVEALRKRDAALLTKIVVRCIALKMDVVERDELDNGLRNILNYGHTFGHALEAMSGYGRWLHGEAVSLGMEVAARIAVARGLLAEKDALRQRRLLAALGLPITSEPIDVEAALEAMQRDKKVRYGRMRWVLPSRIGHIDLYKDIDVETVREAIMDVCRIIKFDNHHQ
jgi:shikimate kinase/3-dehydroquinate synthase